LHIGVRDHRPLGEAEQLAITGRHDRGQGLWRVRESAVTVGVTAHADGKTVWATISTSVH
jgi:hypothetical protein